ncbi:MAG: Tex family protein [Saccharofermentanales bacterium]|jgi:uncharacterized protein
MSISSQIAKEFKLQSEQVDRIIALIEDGNTIPFIARYRKEATGNLDDQVLRDLDDRLKALRGLEARKADVLRLIAEQGQLTPDLAGQIEAAVTQTEVEDIYRPFRPKRRTRASLARDRGLQPLADLLLAQQADEGELDKMAGGLINPDQGVADLTAVYEGAMDILAEQTADQPWIRQRLRQQLLRHGVLVSKAKTGETTVYEPYYDYQEPVSTIASHRVLAINRGEREKILTVKVQIDTKPLLEIIRSRLIRRESAATPWLERVAEDAWKRLLQPSLETEVRNALTEKAEIQAIKVFKSNLRSLLLQPPIRGRRVMGIDPGYRTGCKIAIVDATGRVLDTGVIYPTPPQNQVREAGVTVHRLIEKHRVDTIAIGNGTASRETEIFVADLIREQKSAVQYLMVSEAGASVYSASRPAAEEFPTFDVSLRSAVSIARRLQDPLAELVKIEPRSLGVGQYQHDMNSKKLDESLAGVVEDCVNQVGVDLNTASSALLSYVSGLSTTVARNVVGWREKNGPFPSRAKLLDVPQLGPRTFEQCAGFLRIPGAANPLDNTAVHPESYQNVEQLSRMMGILPSPALADRARQQNAHDLAAKLGLGVLTLSDILEALSKPGRDPRDDLPQPTLRSDVLDLQDLKPGMILHGVVRNVADFGAFVDVGVHQDGLVHISEMADHFVKNPHGLVNAGQPVKVRVLRIDPDRKRISLSMKDLDQP